MKERQSMFVNGVSVPDRLFERKKEGKKNKDAINIPHFVQSISKHFSVVFCAHFPFLVQELIVTD